MQHRIRIVSEDDVDHILTSIPPSELVDMAMSLFSTLHIHPEGVQSPLRHSITSDNHTTLFMPCRVAGAGGSGIKVVAVPKPGVATGLPAATMVFDNHTGKVEALINATALTAVRNAAASALSLQLCGVAEPSALVVFGSGAQAYHHAELITKLHPSITSCIFVVRELNERAQTLVQKMRMAFRGRSVSVRAIESQSDTVSMNEALRSADILVTATPSTEPLFASNNLNPSAHVIMIGSYKPHMHEVDSELILSAALIIVDSVESCLHEAGEIIHASKLLAAKDGGEPPSNPPQFHADLPIVELGRLVSENEDVNKPSKRETGKRTVFKSVGIGAQDVSIARKILNWAQMHSVGTVIPF